MLYKDTILDIYTKNIMLEQDPEIPPPEPPGEGDIPEDTGMAETPTPNQVPDEGGMGATSGFETPEQEIQTDEYIGKVYELKKIHSRLLSLSSFLEVASDPRLLKLRSFIGEALGLFRVVTSNLDSFKGRIDDVIIVFYKFLKYCYALVLSYYQQKEKENRGEI